MKKIEAVIQPHRLETVKESLRQAGIDGITVTEVRGHGRQKGHREMYRGQEYQVDLLPKVKIELALPDERLTAAIDAIVASARTGKIGDGKIFVYELGQALRIRDSVQDTDD
jgi:nitrogen regulatory protein P-II 1